MYAINKHGHTPFFHHNSFVENLTLIGTVVLVHLLAVMSPGPDFIMVIKNALTYSRKAGIWTAIGIATGISVHVFYSLAGLALIISQSILLFNTFKLLGAAYLIYLGVKSFFLKSSHLELDRTREPRPDLTRLQAVKIGFLTNVLNPKATLFFLSLFTLVISPDTSAPVLGIVSVIMIINTALWFMLLSVVITHQRIRRVFERSQNVFNKTFGGLLIALGIKVALAKR